MGAGPGLGWTAPNRPEEGRGLGSKSSSTIYCCDVSGMFLTLSELISSPTNEGVALDIIWGGANEIC